MLQYSQGRYIDMRDFISQIFLCMTNANLAKINLFIEENCLFINYDRTLLGKDKICNYIQDSIKNKEINHLSILNSLQEKRDTLLITYNAFTTSNTSPVYGSAIIRMKDNKINYIKNYIVK